jgi:hypothetical protein
MSRALQKARRTGSFPHADHARRQSRNTDYQGHFSWAALARYIHLMSTASQVKYKCAQCEQFETSCECEKFCCLCQSVIDIRLCNDGLLYCEPCRSACDYKTSA